MGAAIRHHPKKIRAWCNAARRSSPNEGEPHEDLRLLCDRTVCRLHNRFSDHLHMDDAASPFWRDARHDGTDTSHQRAWMAIVDSSDDELKVRNRMIGGVNCLAPVMNWRAITHGRRTDEAIDVSGMTMLIYKQSEG